MKSIFKQFIIAAFLQIFLAASLFSQKYENGTRLLKGAEVLSATPLQLDYVLENLSDTANITVNLHEGKTHLILNDGSGKWREWWYHQGRWKVKIQESQGALPEGLEGSIQTKSGNSFAGSALGVNDGIIKPLSTTDVGIMNNNATLRVNQLGEAEHRRADNHFNFRSSLSDTTFYVRNRIRFDQPNTSYQLSINTKNNGKMNLVNKSGDNISQIVMSNENPYQNVIDLISQNVDGSSQINIVSKGKFTNSGNNVVNDMILNLAKTSMTWKDNNKSREFTLDEGTMMFKTKQGSTETVNFYVNSGGLNYSIANSYFVIGDNYLYFRPKGGGDFLTYTISEKLLRVKDAIMFATDDISTNPGPRISLTNDHDLKFSRETQPTRSITLTEIIQKGQIIESESEPTISNNSFAFWVNDGDFYLILNSSGVQKKLKLQ